MVGGKGNKDGKGNLMVDGKGNKDGKGNLMVDGRGNKNSNTGQMKGGKVNRCSRSPGSDVLLNYRRGLREMVDNRERGNEVGHNE
jgi:hypothetical protein